MTSAASSSSRIHLFLLLSAIAILTWSGIHPNGQFNWFMETFPAMLGGIILVLTYRRFRFSTFTYILCWLFAIILMIGGHYTYAEVPIGNWAKDALGLSRNHFDRVGHFMQGVIPAALCYELLSRQVGVSRKGWLAFLCICVALAISASYEIFEMSYAITYGGKQADDFLGSQGDIWDAQKDMLMALLGSATLMVIYCLTMPVRDTSMSSHAT